MKKDYIYWGIGFIFLILLILFAFKYPSYTGFVVTSLNSCTDSDGGKIYNVSGFVWGDYYLSTKINYSESDYCINDKKLVEYYCFGDYLNAIKKSIVYKCQNSCEEGRCIGNDTEEVPQSFWIRLKHWLRIY